MNDQEIAKLSADEIIKQYNCAPLEEFDDVLTYEITKQYVQR